MGVEPEDLEPKVDYLFQSIGGSQDMLRRFPMYLSFDLELHIRPRAEFLRAMGVEPLKNGISFLVTAPEKEIAHLTGVKEELFHKFMVAFTNLWKEKALKKMYDSSTNNYALNKTNEPSKRSDHSQDSGDRGYTATPEDILLDELDFDF
jgi:hypothetical protein